MTPRHVAVMAICERTATLYGLSADDIFGRSKSKTVCEARKVAMYAARERLGWSFPELGRAFERDHSCVIYAHGSVGLLKDSTPRVANAVRLLMLIEEPSA